MAQKLQVLELQPKRLIGRDNLHYLHTYLNAPSLERALSEGFWDTIVRLYRKAVSDSIFGKGSSLTSLLQFLQTQHLDVSRFRNRILLTLIWRISTPDMQTSSCMNKLSPEIVVGIFRGEGSGGPK